MTSHFTYFTISKVATTRRYTYAAVVVVVVAADADNNVADATDTATDGAPHCKYVDSSS